MLCSISYFVWRKCLIYDYFHLAVYFLKGTTINTMNIVDTFVNLFEKCTCRIKAFNYIAFLILILLWYFPAHKLLHGIWAIQKPIKTHFLLAVVELWYLGIINSQNLCQFRFPFGNMYSICSKNYCCVHK